MSDGELRLGAITSLPEISVREARVQCGHFSSQGPPGPSRLGLRVSYGQCYGRNHGVLGLLLPHKVLRSTSDHNESTDQPGKSFQCPKPQCYRDASQICPDPSVSTHGGNHSVHRPASVRSYQDKMDSPPSYLMTKGRLSCGWSQP